LPAFEAAIRPNTRMIWVESPSNPLLKLIDLPPWPNWPNGEGFLSVIDNTFATPYCQRPLTLGFDIVVHSTTKYVNGHSDIIGGAVVTGDAELTERVRFVQNAVGAIASPFDSFLALRGLKTLALRMERHCANALALAEWLERQPGVLRVLYPGLKSHPQHALAKRQMNGYGGNGIGRADGGIDPRDGGFSNDADSSCWPRASAASRV